MQAYKEGELHGAGVLELVDDEEPEPAAELLLDVWTLDERERAVDHVDEVDDAPVLLPVVVRLEAHARGVVDAADHVPDLGLQARVMLHARGHLHDGIDDRGDVFGRVETLQAYPVGPQQLPVSRPTQELFHEVARLLGLLDTVVDLPQVAGDLLERLHELAVEGVAVALRGTHQGQQPCGRAFGHVGQRRRGDAVATRERHQVLDGRQPVGTTELRVPAQLEAVGESLDAVAEVGVQPPLEGLAQPARLVARQHVDLRGQTRVDRKLLHQPQTDRVHRPEVREGQTLRPLVRTRGNERAADARSQLGGGTPGIGDGGQRLGVDGVLAAGRDRVDDDLGEAVRLAAPRAGAHQGEGGGSSQGRAHVRSSHSRPHRVPYEQYVQADPACGSKQRSHWAFGTRSASRSGKDLRTPVTGTRPLARAASTHSTVRSSLSQVSSSGGPCTGRTPAKGLSSRVNSSPRLSEK